MLLSRVVLRIYSLHNDEENLWDKVYQETIGFIAKFTTGKTKFYSQTLLMLVENTNNYDFLLCLWPWNENKPNSMFLKQFLCSWVKELRTTSAAAGKRMFG